MGLNVTIVQFGKETDVELGEGATYGDVLAKVPNAANLDIRAGGQPISAKASERVRQGEKLTAAPRQVKQGL